MKYYELETPEILTSEKNVIKIYKDHGKLQVFPRVSNTKHGIGRGSTLDLNSLDVTSLTDLKMLLNEAIDYQIQIRKI